MKSEATFNHKTESLGQKSRSDRSIFLLFVTIISASLFILFISSTVWGTCLHIHHYGMRNPYSTLHSEQEMYELPKLISDNNLSEQLPRIVFSLTTSPKRLHLMKDTLDSLIAQDLVPNRIQINLPHQFKRTGETYSNLEEIAYLKHPLIYINRCDDLGPATKLIPTLFTERNSSTLIIIVDDDTIYPHQLTKVFAKLYISNPAKVVVGHCGDIYLKKGINESTSNCRMFEAYAGVGFRRSLFKDDFMDYMKQSLQDDRCFRSDDYVVSNYFASQNTLGIKAERLLPGVVQLDTGKGNDALHKLEWSESSHDLVYGKCEKFLQSKGLAKIEIKYPHIRTWSEMIPRRHKERLWNAWMEFWHMYC